METVYGLQANNFEFMWNLRGRREILPKIASSFARNLRVLTSKRLLPILHAASQFLGEIFSRFRSQNNSANYAGKRSVIEEAHKEQGLAQMVQMWGILWETSNPPLFDFFLFRVALSPFKRG